jgi:hypothetical protein
MFPESGQNPRNYSRETGENRAGYYPETGKDRKYLTRYSRAAIMVWGNMAA